MSTASKLAECETFRKVGAAWFEEGQYVRAGEKFRKMLVWLEYTFAEDEDEQQAVDSVLHSALALYTTCMVQTEKWDEVVRSCYRSLKMDPNDVRALSSRARAYRQRGDFENARADLVCALRADPSSTMARREYAMLKSQVSAYRDRSRRMGKAMFFRDEAAAGAEDGSESNGAHPPREVRAASPFCGGKTSPSPYMFPAWPRGNVFHYALSAAFEVLYLFFQPFLYLSNQTRR